MDEITLKNIPLKIVEKEGDQFDVSKNGGPSIAVNGESQLKKHLAQYLISNDTYADIRRQLDETGIAEVSVPLPGKFSQI
jgi:hypothetical protein